MLILNKKYRFVGIGIFSILLFLLLSLEAQAAISSKIKQVRTKSNPAVYFLDHGAHRKKAYLNPTAYLNYGNKWSDIKFVSSTDLNSWPEAKLLKIKGSPAVYYIQGAKRALILNMTDLQDFSLHQEPILTVSQIDLNQYQLVTYEEIGLSRDNRLLVFNDLVTNQNNNTILTNTGGNLMGIFRFRSPAETATITALTFNISGLYGNASLDSAFVSDANGNSYGANVSLRLSSHEIYVNFSDPLVFDPGEEKTVEVFLNLKSCTCNNQTIRVELKSAANVNASLPVAGNFPLQGTLFKLLSSSSLLGNAKIQEQSLASSNLVINNGSRLLGQFTLSEETGNENVAIKRLTFSNDGSAGKNDWEDFRLLRNGEIIARVNEVDENDKIVFNINYLRVEKGSPVELTVLAGLKTDYNPAATFNLQVTGLWAVGVTQNFSLQSTINNLGETYPLN